MIFSPIIDLRIKHAFYPDGQCDDFQLAPNPATARLLANYRCLVRAFPDGLQITTSLGADRKTPMLPLPPGTRLVFEMRLANADFPLFTDLSTFDQNLAPYFTTDGAPNASPLVLRLAARTASQTEALVFPAGVAQATFTLGGRPLPSTPPASYTPNGLTGGKTAALANNGRQITVTASPAPGSRPFSVTYPVQPQLPEGVFAEIEIVVNQAAGAGTETLYQIQFIPRSATWRYYVVGPSATTYTIDYSPPTGPKVTFAAASLDHDGVAQSLQQLYSGNTAVAINCLASSSPLPCLPTASPCPTLKSSVQNAESEPLAPPPWRNLCLVSGAPTFFQIVRKTVKS